MRCQERPILQIGRRAGVAAAATAYQQLTSAALLGSLTDPAGYLSGATGLSGGQLTIEHDATNHQTASLDGWNETNIPYWRIPLADLFAGWNIENGFFGVKIELDTFASDNNKSGIAVALINDDGTPAGAGAFVADTNVSNPGWGNQTATSRGVRATAAGTALEMVWMACSSRMNYQIRRNAGGTWTYVYQGAGTVMTGKAIANMSLQISSFQDTAIAVAHSRVYSVYTSGWSGPTA